MLTQQAVIDFCNQYDYDIRKSGNGRWIDQKCAADVVTVIADCVYNYALEDDDGIFTTADIWHYKYAVENVEAIFKKPGVENEAARSEYDKFFQQPMEMLANARVLTKTKQGNRNFYQINNFEVLEYIALRERNALVIPLPLFTRSEVDFQMVFATRFRLIDLLNTSPVAFPTATFRPPVTMFATPPITARPSVSPLLS